MLGIKAALQEGLCEDSRQVAGASFGAPPGLRISSKLRVREIWPEAESAQNLQQQGPGSCSEG